MMPRAPYADRTRMRPEPLGEPLRARDVVDRVKSDVMVRPAGLYVG